MGPDESETADRGNALRFDGQNDFGVVAHDDRFLLEDGELPQLVEDLEILHYEEGWLREDRHDAVVVARRPRADP